MSDRAEIKQQVKEFYDQIGWREISQGIYENALYEDLRPVSRDYIHQCHLRVSRHLKPEGHFFLDAGSGPVQYPEYLEYSRHYEKRICVDISIVALQAARNRLQDHGLYVVADIANLPFKEEAFDGIISLHTIHHLPQEEHLRAYAELYRVLKSGNNAVVVVGWQKPFLTRLFNAPHRLLKRLKVARRQFNRADKTVKPTQGRKIPKGTFVDKYDAGWLKQELGNQIPIEILVWRSIGGRTLRTYIHDKLGGRFWLRLLYRLEERFPHFFGEKGTYPLIVIRKKQASQ